MPGFRKKLPRSIAETTRTELAKKSGIKRSTVYALLEDMKSEHLVALFEKGKIIFVRPEPPERLQSLIDARVRNVGIAQELSRDMQTSLTRQYHLSIGKPTIRYFEGEEGLKEIFNDIYAPKNVPVYGCVDLETADQAFPQYVARELIPLRLKHKLFACSLLADSPEARMIAERDEEQLRKTILLDKKAFPVPAEIDVYEDKIAMLSFEKGQFIGIIIQNEAFAKSLRSIFMRNFPSKQHQSMGQTEHLPSGEGESLEHSRME